MMKYEIKYATRMKEVIFMSFLFSVVMFQIGVWTKSSYPIFFYAQIAVNLVLVGALLIEMYARFVRRGVMIQSDQKSIVINGEVIRAEDLEEIRISGCRSAAFGLKLKESKRMRYTFKFLDSKCEGVREIVKFAEMNGVNVIKTGPQSPLIEAM
ncbi:hypothetical protein E6C60_2284 [Paenibacillus algicola]|uniref:Uncharacterized protein n=1 Tax=Paenibacillus algicola TaxID=2565926 RepID=A0A4P8XK06_9BACL|nr:MULTISPECIES: hypothetical protein [Paenibacillus]QCT02996.1 hypothetical protein E6C60_2284 [Paenibacillus algicola]